MVLWMIPLHSRSLGQVSALEEKLRSVRLMSVLALTLANCLGNNFSTLFHLGDDAQIMGKNMEIWKSNSQFIFKSIVQSESPTSFEKVVDNSFEKKFFLLIFSMN